MMINSLSIIYPIYNEEKRLKYIFSDIKKFNKNTKNINKEFIFVDDGSIDNSKIILEKFIKEEKSLLNYKAIKKIEERGML